MNTITTLEDITVENKSKPEVSLNNAREQKGYTIDYVASKLRLRVRVIELLENNEFHLLPEPVFIKGYLRAYAKLLNISPEPYLAEYESHYDEHYVAEKKPERSLIQTRRENNKADYMIRWFTILFALGVVVAVGLWWQKNIASQQTSSEKSTSSDLSMNQTKTELKLTDISKMQDLLTPRTGISSLERSSD